jgi:hypothetical protein
LLDNLWLTLSSPINKSAGRDTGDIDSRRKMEIKRIKKRWKRK